MHSARLRSRPLREAGRVGETLSHIGLATPLTIEVAVLSGSHHSAHTRRALASLTFVTGRFSK